jgi:hypothetical protein
MAPDKTSELLLSFSESIRPRWTRFRRQTFLHGCRIHDGREDMNYSRSESVSAIIRAASSGDVGLML